MKKHRLFYGKAVLTIGILILIALLLQQSFFYLYPLLVVLPIAFWLLWNKKFIYPQNDSIKISRFHVVVTLSVGFLYLLNLYLFFSIIDRKMLFPPISLEISQALFLVGFVYKFNFIVRIILCIFTLFLFVRAFKTPEFYAVACHVIGGAGLLYSLTAGYRMMDSVKFLYLYGFPVLAYLIGIANAVLFTALVRRSKKRCGLQMIAE